MKKVVMLIAVGTLLVLPVALVGSEGNSQGKSLPQEYNLYEPSNILDWCSTQNSAILFNWDFDVSDQGFTALCPANDPQTCSDGVQEWGWGSYDGIPPSNDCNGNTITNFWGIALGEEYSYTHSCSRLVSPPFDVPQAVSITLEICHWMDSEGSPPSYSYDGGNVNILTSGEPDDPGELLDPCGGTPYDMIINTSTYYFACLVDNEMGFTGHYTSWVTSLFDLTPYAGMSGVRIAFDFGSDESIQYYGWYIHYANIWTQPTGVEEKANLPVITSFSVSPNPSVGEATVTFTLSKTSNVEITLFDATGRVVENLGSGTFTSGEHTLRVSANPGVYFVKLEAPGKTELQKLVILR